MTFLALLSPVVATALDWIVRGQRLSPLQAVGGLIVLGSVVASQLQRSPPTHSRRDRACTSGGR